jgi:GTP-binding protein
MIKERLLKECESNVTLEVKLAADTDSFEVHGRGELQLGILIEQMRREGFEVSISPPRVLYRDLSDGTQEEPWEDVTIDVPPDHTGPIINSLQERGGDMVEFKQDEHRCVATPLLLLPFPRPALYGMAQALT